MPEGNRRNTSSVSCATCNFVLIIMIVSTFREHCYSGTESDKSFVDDFDMELGIVRARVGLSYDPLR
jgi:hypothetical protein